MKNSRPPFSASPRVLTQPSSDFNQSRSGLRSLAFYLDIDLATLRTKTGTGANSPLIFPLAGNSFYVDANPDSGNFRVTFQDTNSDQAATALYASPGTIFNLPFTQLLITNPAQAGKTARIVYGVDIDFQPGSIAQIALAGSVTLSDPSKYPLISTGSFASIATLVANTPETVFSPASNVNGAIILSADSSEFDASFNNGGLIAKSSAPVSAVDGEMIMQTRSIGAYATTNLFGGNTLNQPHQIAAGLGLYFIRTATLAAANGNMRSVRYKLL